MLSLLARSSENQCVNDNDLQDKIKRVTELLSKLSHLPEINETQVSLFLRKWDHDLEKVKNAIDKYFTYKTQHADLFLDRNPFDSSIQKTLDVFLVTILPKKTPEGYSVLFVKVMDPDVEKFDVPIWIKLFDMVTTLNLFQEEPSEGYIIILDVASMTERIMEKLSPSIVEKYFYCLQELTPWNLVALHYFNTSVAFLDDLLNMVKPLFTVLKDRFYVHSNVEELSKYVPLECLPGDYGGSLESTQVLQKNVKALLEKNAAFFELEDKQRVDESKKIDLRIGATVELGLLKNDS